MPTPPKIRQVVESALYVQDLARSRKFYEEILGLRFVSQTGDRDVFFATSQNMVLLFRAAETELSTGVPAHGARGCQHIAFEIDGADYDAWKLWLTQHGVAITKEVKWDGPQDKSLYFCDPDGHVLELVTRGMWATLR